MPPPCAAPLPTFVYAIIPTSITITTLQFPTHIRAGVEVMLVRKSINTQNAISQNCFSVCILMFCASIFPVSCVKFLLSHENSTIVIPGCPGLY